MWAGTTPAAEGMDPGSPKLLKLNKLVIRHIITNLRCRRDLQGLGVFGDCGVGSI